MTDNDTIADNAAPALFDRIALIGLGLIGSSIARAVKAKGLAGHIAGCARSQGTLDTAMELGFIDSAHQSARAAVEDADLVILCIPVGASGTLAEAVAPALRPGAILSDVGSTKGSVIAAVAPHVPDGVHFIPAHPLAGTEHSGPEAGFAELFEDRWCILTPPEGADADQVARLRAFWEGMGSRVDAMDPDHHDRAVAITSHLPHLIAYTIVGVADDLEEVSQSEVVKYSAGGFRDFTRIAASDPTMWRDVFVNNREAVLDLLSRFEEELFSLQRAIRWGDGEALFDHFTRTRAIRRGIIDAGQDVDVADFGRRDAPAPAPRPTRKPYGRAAEAAQEPQTPKAGERFEQRREREKDREFNSAKRHGGPGKPHGKRFEDRPPRREGGFRSEGYKGRDEQSRGYKPRERDDRGQRDGGGERDRPRRDDDRGGYRPRGEGYKPRGEGGYKPRGEGGYKPRGEGGYKPREGGDHPRGEGGYKPRGEGGYKPRGEGGYKPRGEGGYKPREGGDRPRGEGGYKPRGEGGYKPRGEGGYKPRGDGPSREGPRRDEPGRDRPVRERSFFRPERFPDDRPRGKGPSKGPRGGGGDRPFRPRRDD